jgi:lipid A disaccharide synthetase
MRLEWRLRRRKLNITAMAIPNIIAEDMVIPELMAEDVTVDNIIAALRKFVDDPEHARETRRRLLGVRAALEPGDALQTAASRIVETTGL